jgi:5-methylcytosine-specific restriction enzyme A
MKFGKWQKKENKKLESEFKIVTKTPRIRIPADVRNYVFDRDRHQCQSCGLTDHNTELNIDHIIPISKGGSNDISNLQTLCRQCNQRKRNHFDSRFHRRYKL